MLATSGAARQAAYAAGQAAAVAHVAAHKRGAAAYAIKAARGAIPEEGDSAGRLDYRWQTTQRLRNDICWSMLTAERASGRQQMLFTRAFASGVECRA